MSFSFFLSFFFWLFSAETKGEQNALAMSLKDLAEPGKLSEHETDSRRLIIDL